MRKLANALGVSVDDFFTEEPADPKAATPPGSAPAVAGSRGEGRLARLEATTTSILSTIEELDPANNPLDRVAVDYIEAQILEITRVLAEKTGARDNPLPSRLRDILETEGEETEVLGIVETPVRPLMAWSKHQPTDQPRVSDRRQRP